MLKWITTFSIWVLFLALIRIPAHAQVHGSGGGPGVPADTEAYCEGLLGKTREKEKEYLESRGIPYKNDKSFFSEIRKMNARNMLKVLNSSPLVKNACHPGPAPAHSEDQLRLLKEIQGIWKQGIPVRDHCLHRFTTRYHAQGELDCVIGTLSHESK